MHDAPKTRNASGIIADLIENGDPLDAPIRFGKKTLRSGRIERTSKGRKFAPKVDLVFTMDGRRVPRNMTKLVKWNGKYHRVHKDICG